MHCQEWFKEAEKEAKLKPFCKVNLQLGEKLDAPTLAKHQTMHWVSDALVKLCELQETLEVRHHPHRCAVSSIPNY